MTLSLPSLRRVLGCVAASALLLVVAIAQDKPPVQGMIWKAVSPDGFTVYLVGSVHFGAKEMYPLPKAFDDGFAQATDVIEEVDMNELNSEETETLALQTVAYPPDDSLAHHVSPATLDLVKQYAKEKGIPFERLCLLKPWALAYTIPVLTSMKNPGQVEPVPGIDDFFAKKAKQGHKKLVGLETATFQFKLLSDLPGQDQETFLTAVVKAAISPTPASGPSELAVMQGYWIKGDVEALNGYLEKSFSGFPADYVKRLLYDRNLHMVEVLERYVKYRKPCLMIVGAGHLIGPKGIVKTLQDKGYQVTQILSPVASAKA